MVAPDAHLLLDDLKVILPSTTLGIIDDEVGQALGLSDIVTLPEIPPNFAMALLQTLRAAKWVSDGGGLPCHAFLDDAFLFMK